MNSLLLLLATTTSAPPAQPIAAELAPMPAVIPDARQLAAWVADLSAPDYERQRKAYEALLRTGPRAKDAVPDLIKLLSAKEEKARPAFVAHILGEIGPDAKEAVPQLIASLQPGFYGYMNDTIALALAKIDAPRPEATLALLMSSGKCDPIILARSQYLQAYPGRVVPHLVEFCSHKDAHVRERAVLVLGGMAEAFNYTHVGSDKLLFLAGKGAKDVPATLERLLADESAIVRLTAAQAIAHVAPHLAEKTIPVVIAAHTDPKVAPTVEHYQASSIFRPIPDPAAKALIPLFDSDRDNVRQWAIMTLAALPLQKQIEDVLKDGKTARTREAAALCFGGRYSSGTAAVPALTAALGDREFVVRFAAAVSIVQIVPKGDASLAAVVPALIEGLKQPSDATRLEASRNLVRAGEPARAAVPELRNLLGGKNRDTALEAALALLQIDRTAAPDTVPALINGLAGSDTQATRAAKALAPLGSTAGAAVPALVEKLDGKSSPFVRLAAAEAVGRIDATLGEKATAVLAAFLEEKKGDGLKRDAISALGRLGAAAKSAFPALLKKFESKNPKDGDYRVELALSLVAIDPAAAKPVLKWVEEQITKNGEDAYELADRIESLEAQARPFLPVLMVMLKAKTPYYRTNAVEALVAIGPDAREALPLLKEMAEKDTHPRAKKLAAEAVKKLEAK